MFIRTIRVIRGSRFFGCGSAALSPSASPPQRLRLPALGCGSDNESMTEAANRERTIRLIRPPTSDGVGVFCFSGGRETVFYTFHEVPCEIGGRGFAVHRLGLGQVYHVRVGKRSECSCECLGVLKRGHCKHVSGL